MAFKRSKFRSRVEPPVGGKGLWKKMVLDENVELNDPSKPPFISAPPGSKPYFGHPLLEETRTDGWCLGIVTDPFEPDCAEGCTIGDAFVEAPDGSRAGLVWTVEPTPRFAVLCEPDGERWGVFHFSVLRPITTMEDLQEAFVVMVPALEMLYERFHS